MGLNIEIIRVATDLIKFILTTKENMNQSNKLLSDIVTFRTYAKHLHNFGRREVFEETLNRNMQMHLDKFPKLSRDIVKAYQRVHEYKVMPSMRALQFGGEAIEKNNIRSYNCSFLHINDVRSFGETLFLLLSGTGVGFSCQRRHTNQLPILQMPREEGIYVVHDSITGWAQALDALVDAYFYGRMRPVFDFSNVRAKGSYLVTTGAKAPGPAPLKYMLEQVEIRFKAALGRRLKSIEVHDIVCIIADCVLSGGIRRAALISLFDRTDEEMLKAKHGTWWEKHPYRARANNSAVLPRGAVKKEQFEYIFKMCIESGSGEPGFFWTNDENIGTNPCVTGDTEILTDDGYKRIDECLDNPVNVWNGFEWSEVQPKITGTNQQILTITFSDGRILNCTPYHKFHIAKNYKGDTEVVEAKDLESGMKLIKHEFPIIEHGEELKNAYTQGFVAADGMELNKTLYVYEPKEMCLNRLDMDGIKSIKWEENNKRHRVTLLETPVSKNLVPVEYNLKSKLDWLSGLFDGDGTELKEGGLQLVSVNRQFISDVQKLLSTVGVQSKVLLANKAGLRPMPDGKGGTALFQCQDSYRICIGAIQMQKLKSLGLKCERMSFDKTPQRDASQFVTVVDVTENGTAETVYCFNEPKRHLGIFGGVITGQCAEISLNTNQFCNLTTINQTGVKDKKDWLNRVYAATLLGTLQAAYTDFPYLRPIWKSTTEQEALLGVSCTGIADAHGQISGEWLEEGAKLAKDINTKYASKLGINPAARITTIKPEGTASCVLGSSSGIHSRHSDFYLRRVRMNKDDALGLYLKNAIPELVEDDIMSASGIVVTIPQESPKGAIVRDVETVKTLFERTIFYHDNWIKYGHTSGINTHNVSVTISYKESEVDELFNLMWKYRESYTGISLLPFDGGNYKQAPFESCDKETFDKYNAMVKEIDLTKVREETDNTNRAENLACSAGGCEIT